LKTNGSIPSASRVATTSTTLQSGLSVLPWRTFIGSFSGEAGTSRFTGSYEVIRMPGGHWLHLEHPERFRDELLGALRRHAS